MKWFTGLNNLISMCNNCLFCLTVAAKQLDLLQKLQGTTLNEIMHRPCCTTHAVSVLVQTLYSFYIYIKHVCLYINSTRFMTCGLYLFQIVLSFTYVYSRTLLEIMFQNYGVVRTMQQLYKRTPLILYLLFHSYVVFSGNAWRHSR